MSQKNNKKESHLQQNQLTYFQHLKRSLSLSFLFLKGFICGSIHALIPQAFDRTMSKIAIKVTLNDMEHRKKLRE